MKTIKQIFSVLVIMVLCLLLSGCLEYTVITQVMEDGSIQRTMIVRGDSSLIYKQVFLLYDDPTWETSTYHEFNDQGDTFVLEARKSFPNVKTLNEDIFSDTVFTDQINIKADLTKEVKGFYNLFTYSETYQMFFPFKIHAIEDFMTASELSVYNAESKNVYYDAEKDSLFVMADDTNVFELDGADSLRYQQLMNQVEEKYEQWAKLNVFDGFYLYLQNSFANLDFTPDTDRQKNYFYEWLEDHLVFEDGLNNPQVFLAAAAEFYGLDSARIRLANISGFDEFYHKMEVMASNMDSFTNQILMPGMVIHSNSGLTDGNLVTWHFTTNDFYAKDYHMRVQSRIINRWMIVIIAAVVFFITGILITWLVLKRKK